MATPCVGVLRAPGTNCDHETAFAFERCGARVERVHLFRILEQPARLREFQVLCIPGGFSYGDDVGSGVIFGSQLRTRLGNEIREFLQTDRLVLGICNGFQVLVKAGILPGGAETWPPRAGDRSPATLTWNDSGRFTDRWIHLVTNDSPCVFLRGIERLELPIAHAEGKVVPASDEVLQGWQANRQIPLCYSSPEGKATFDPLPFPDNPNGSIANIAGLSDRTGRVFGLMPHPERYQFATQHPQWTRRRFTSDEGQGLQIFRNAVAYFQG